MLYFKKIFVIFFILIFCLNTSSANEVTAFIDVNYILQNSNIGKKTINQINDLDKKNIEKFEKKNKELKKLETDLRNKKNIISEDDFQKQVELFQNKIQVFTAEKNKTVDSFQIYRKEELQKLFTLFKPIISDYMKQNSIAILIDAKNVFMGIDDSNLTNEILNIINDKLK